MYSNKQNINILTSLLIDKGITDAVVCPGSRNAPIVHNLNEAEQIACHPVTDERSAGFYAIGMAQATGRPVVVCVTSGTALLNLAPAVAEAHYQHVPLVVVSADRPLQWIDQLDGQTLPQQGAFGTMAQCSVSLPEPHDDEQRWHCRRLVNEALHKATATGGQPVHINVPISEPLFTFDVGQLPCEHVYRLHRRHGTTGDDTLARLLAQASRPMIVLGQMPRGAVSAATMQRLMATYAVIAEPLANDSYTTVHGDEAVRMLCRAHTDGGTAPLAPDHYMPDYIIYIGGTIVSKPVRRFLRKAHAPSCLVTTCALDTPDPLMTLTDIVECAPCDIDALLTSLCDMPGDRTFSERWHTLLAACERRAESYEPPYSQMAAIKYFESQLDDLDTDLHVHYANSTAVRLACIYAAHRVWCNRGVNGIEGTLSTAAGFSLATGDMVVCVTGDLSFFYDQNALWNKSLRGNLRIILLNNHGGGIFAMLPGLEASAAAHDMVAAAHDTDARGICTQNDIGYLKAGNIDEMQVGIVTLLTQPSTRPMLLEVFTDSKTDAEVLKKYYDM